MWPDAGIQSSPNFPKVAQKVATAVFTSRVVYLLQDNQKMTKFLGYFCKKNWYRKLFKKLLNLVTLLNRPFFGSSILTPSHSIPLFGWKQQKIFFKNGEKIPRKTKFNIKLFFSQFVLWFFTYAKSSVAISIVSSLNIFCCFRRLDNWVVSNSVLNIGLLCHALGCEFEQRWRQKPGFDPQLWKYLFS